LLDGINILVADDNVLNQKVTEFMLKKQGAGVQTVSNGAEVVDLLLKGNCFDVLLVDIHMPLMDGFKTTQYIRKDINNNMPVIGLTADLFDNATEACIEAGMNACVCRPFDPDFLYELILSMIRH
jgi:CheY-like chemotaxis protein